MAMTFWQRLSGFLLWGPRLFGFFVRLSPPTPEAVQASTRRFLGPCSACGKGLSGHQHWPLASAFVDEPRGQIEELAQLIEAGEWERAERIREWQWDRDEREYVVLNCPDTSTITLLSVIYTAALSHDDWVEWRKTLALEDADAVRRVVGSRWMPL